MIYLRGTVFIVLMVAVVMLLTRREPVDQSLGMPYKEVAQSVAGRGNAEPSVQRTPRSEDPVAGSGAGFSLEQRAKAGDARAQWKWSEQLHKCSVAIKLSDRMGEPIDGSDQCRKDGFVPGDEWKAWRAKAIANQDPVALLYEAMERQVQKEPGADEQFEAAAALAARSHDPEAQIVLGWLLIRGGGEDAIDGLAWIHLACPDCTADDPRLGTGAEVCGQTGACPSNMPFLDWIATEEPDGEEAVREIRARAASLAELYPKS